MATVLAQVEAILENLPPGAFDRDPATGSWSEAEWSSGLVAAAQPPRRSRWLAWLRR